MKAVENKNGQTSNGSEATRPTATAAETRRVPEGTPTAAVNAPPPKPQRTRASCA